MSKICGVPRSRIYDVGDSLAERGLVEACLHRIQAACRRGVRVIVATESTDIHELIEDHAPGCTIVSPDADALGLPLQDGILGRIVMVGREAVLVATLGSDEEPHVIGVWGSGPENGFVAVLSQLLGNWVDNSPHVVTGDWDRRSLGRARSTRTIRPRPQ